MSASSSDWTELLVGHQRPKGLGIINGAATNRGNTASANYHFADLLRQQQLTSLINQEGVTANDIREAHEWGEQYHRHIGDTNGTIASAYQFSGDTGSELDRELTGIANDGNSSIKHIQASKDPLPIKVGKITDVVMDCQTQANIKAATRCDDVFNQIQNVLDKRGIPMSARQFAKGYGIEPAFGSPNRDAVREQVETALNQSETSAGTQVLGRQFSTPEAPASPARSPESSFVGDTPALTPAANAPGAQPQTPPQTYVGPTPSLLPAGAPAPQTQNSPQTYVGPTPALAPAGPPAPAVPAGGGPGAPSLAAGSGGAPMQTPALPNTPLSAVSPIPPAAPPPLTATNLVQSFDHGLQVGTPISPTANAVPPAGPLGPQLAEPAAQAAPTAAPTIPTSAQAPVFDTPHAPAADVTPAPPPVHLPSDAGTTYVAAPAAAATPPIAAAPAGPLPAYGADIRPPIATAPAAPTAPAGPPAATPSSGPVNPSAGPSGLSQPAMVRQQSSQPAQPPTPAAVGEQAVAATAGGAAAGAASAAATARARLQRLVDAAARQEPRLSWAAGDRSDGTTVLVTDLASGWIPPNIGIPTGVELLEPAHRRGAVEALLGEVTFAASYTPIHYLPPEEDGEPVPTSRRARQGPVVDELGWELGKATKWRDGLPRLAHTLARAASAGTGVVDNEIELLRGEVAKVRDQVLDSYPDNIDAAVVQNWQLLAAIDALVGADKIGADYHFAWFQALSQAKTRGAV